MAAPMSLFMMLSLLSSQFSQAWPCKLPFLNNSPNTCFNQGCGKFSFLGNRTSILSFFAWIFASGNVWPTGMEEGVGTLTSQLQQQPSFPKFSCHPDTYYLSLSKAMRGRSARAGPDLVGCWSTSWTSATHQQCLPTFSSHSSTCWSGQLSWNQRQSWTTLKFLHRWAPTSQLLNRLEVSFSISLDEEKQWFVT